MHWTAVFDSTNHRFSLYHGVRLADSSALPAPILPGEPDLYIGRWSRGGTFPLRRHRRLRDLVPRSQRRRGGSDRREQRCPTRSDAASSRRARKKTWHCFSARRVFLYMGGNLPDAFRETFPRGTCSRSRRLLPCVAAGGGAGVYGPDRARPGQDGGGGLGRGAARAPPGRGSGRGRAAAVPAARWAPPAPARRAGSAMHAACRRSSAGCGACRRRSGATPSGICWR